MTTYRQAGVDIDEGDRLVELIKPLARATQRPEVLSGIGGFGGLFALDLSGHRNPVLVAGTDGVGTKLKLAFQAGRHQTVGIDLVAMSVNDIATCGAEPLFFLDYYATSRLSAETASEVVKGIADGCALAGCTLLGGETAELPGFYAAGEYDLAGFAVGVVDREKIIDGRRIRVGDRVLGVASSGLHSNGYSLARKVLLEDGRLSLDAQVPALGARLVDELLKPTCIYAKAILDLAQKVDVRGLAHITGSGIPGNLPRCIPEGMNAALRRSAWKPAPIFELIASLGVPTEEMFSTFNMGIGLCAVVPPDQVDRAIAILREHGSPSWAVGEIVSGQGEASVEWA